MCIDTKLPLSKLQSKYNMYLKYNVAPPSTQLHISDSFCIFSNALFIETVLKVTMRKTVPKFTWVLGQMSYAYVEHILGNINMKPNSSSKILMV